MAVGAFAQTMVPADNFKFSTMELGNPAGIFAKEATQYGGNLNQNGTYLNSVVGDKPGVVVAHSWRSAGGDTKWADMTAEDKKPFEDFYNTFKIVDGGALGKILCYQGNGSTVSDERISKNVSTLNEAPTLCFLTPTTGFTKGKIYRFTYSMRTILNDDVADYEMNMNIKDSQGNEQHFIKNDGSDGGGSF